MPTLSELIGQDLSAYQEADASSSQAGLPPIHSLEPGLNTMIRCPLPTIFQVSPDNLRQFYQGGQIPQNRIFTPNNQTSGTGSSGSTAAIISNSGSSSGSSSGGGTPATSQPIAQQVSVSTASLNPGQTIATSFTVAKSFMLLGLSANNPVRIQMYGTALAQLSDASRGIDVPPAAGTTQNIICDVVLDTSPFNWSFQDRVGANADAPQLSTIYVTLTNVDNKTDAIKVTLTYVPLEG